MAYNYINETGTIQPDTGEILGDVQEEFKNVFGQDLDVSPETPQGLLIAVETEARKSVIRNNALLSNQINPRLSGGVFLDALCGLTALERDGETRSIILATITGVSGTIIPANKVAKTTNGDLFLLQSTTIIPASGTVNAIFYAEEFGPVAVEANSLTEIVDGELGWEAVNNSAAGTLGFNEQNDYSLKILREKTLANQGVALPEAIMSSVYSVGGVKSLSFRENTTNAVLTIDGVDLEPKSIYACVDGGDNIDVAQALLDKKSVGCGWNGAVEVTIIDEFSGQPYTVKFDRPDEKTVLINISVRSENSLVDVVASVKKALIDYANGLIDGEKGFEVGRNVSTWELGGAINRLYPSIFVSSLETSIDGGTTFNALEKEILINEVARLSENDINVTEV